MKTLFKKMVGIVLVCALIIGCVPVMKAKATTLEDQVTQTVAFGEFDTLDLKCEEATVLKIVLKQKGGFVLDFSPTSIYEVDGQLYNENNELVKTYDYFATKQISSENLEAGTYFLRLWGPTSYSVGTYTYFARQIISPDASVEICVNVKKGKTLQLGTIFTNSNDKEVKWSSSNKKIATVSSKGKVKGVKKGTAVIKVFNSSGLVHKIKVKVTS